MRKQLITIGALAFFAASSAFAQENTIKDPEEGMTMPTVEVTEPVRTFVIGQEVPSVALTGNLVVGAVLPGTVDLVEIPGFEYRLAMVNEQRVLVDPATGQVVYIFPAE